MRTAVGRHDSFTPITFYRQLIDSINQLTTQECESLQGKTNTDHAELRINLKLQPYFTHNCWCFGGFE